MHVTWGICSSGHMKSRVSLQVIAQLQRAVLHVAHPVAAGAPGGAGGAIGPNLAGALVRDERLHKHATAGNGPGQQFFSCVCTHKIMCIDTPFAQKGVAS